MKHDHHVVDEVTVQFTFIRHGESTDNLRSVWAGWRDSELSNHAEALAKSFASTSLTAIHSSPLKRALTTAETLKKSQAAPIPLHTSPLLREQNFGRGEGQRYDVRRESALSLVEHIAKGKYPSTYNRSERFPDGESLNDVAGRADQVVQDLILPYVQKAAQEGTDSMHVAFVSHGIFIKELVASLLRQSVGKAQAFHGGLSNTGWVLMTVKVKVRLDRFPSLRHKAADVDVSFPYVRVVKFNSCEHLHGLVRQKGGIGSAAFDPTQKDIRSFFKAPGGPKPS
ncbi:phosphoglycerate mutase-like protein [Lyophyllum atratum]|nr:phosphoglycerate mutase-like protein [Lyophyllum atratum]